MDRWRLAAAPLAAAPLTAALLAGALLALTGCNPSQPSGAPAGTVAPSIAGREPTPLIIDTDMAPDDIVAIASLLRDPGVRVLAITVVGTGEAHCQGGMFVARSIVTMLVAEPVTVACGPPEPLGDAQPFPDAWRAGADAGNGLALVSPTFAPDPRPAGQVLNELAASEAAAGRRLAILTLGTMTNVAAAVQIDPALPEHVTLVSMLGAVDVPGNVTPDVAGGSGPAVAEWNAHADPTAVRIVLEAGFDWTLIPLDATNSVPLTDDLYRELESDSTAGPADLVFELWSKNPYMRSSGFYLWDPLAAAAVRDPGLVETREASIRVVEGAGLDGGQLIEDPAGSRITMAMGADRDDFEAFLLSHLRLGPPRDNAFVPAATLSVRVDDGSCDAGLEPNAAAGTIRIEMTNDGTMDATVFVFGFAEGQWSTIEAFVADPPPLDGSSTETPPPGAGIAEVALIPAPPGQVATVYGTTVAGPVGVACVVGTLADPSINLAGPFTIPP